VKWDSVSNCKADPSLTSFIFSLKNPHNVPARKFALKAAKENEAIYCDPEYGPSFRDVGVRGNSSNQNWADFRTNHCYVNDTGLDGVPFFTGKRLFKMKEIEVFEITD
jgi:hypothetical protein